MVLAAVLAVGMMTATFSMHCYWTGEATLGREPGVLATRIGDLDGREIVQVEFDPAVTSAARLQEALMANDSFHERLDPQATDARPRFVEPKHTLRTQHPDLYYLDLTERQAIVLNSWAYFSGPMPDLLDADQRERWRRLKKQLAAGQVPPPGAAAARSGAALESYRLMLIAWLEEKGP